MLAAKLPYRDTYTCARAANAERDSTGPACDIFSGIGRNDFGVGVERVRLFQRVSIAATAAQSQRASTNVHNRTNMDIAPGRDVSRKHGVDGSSRRRTCRNLLSCYVSNSHILCALYSFDRAADTHT